jgi:transcriptional regulator with XRE-family HTH domain
MADNFNKKLGKRINELRTQIGLSQTELAARLKINRVAVSQIESGQRKMRADEVAKLSKIFNITSDVLLDLKKDIAVFFEKEAESKEKKKPEVRISVPQKNMVKFKEVLLYILNRVGSKPNVGETVIYKLLYFIDFDYYEKYEEQLIGATYIKNNYGPTPKEFIKIVNEMERKEISRVESKFFPYPQKKYLPLREPELSILNARELQMIDSVLERLSNKNAKEMSEYSHNDVPWLTTEDGQIIEYESVFYRTPAYSVRTYNEESVQ